MAEGDRSFHFPRKTVASSPISRLQLPFSNSKIRILFADCTKEATRKTRKKTLQWPRPEAPTVAPHAPLDPPSRTPRMRRGRIESDRDPSARTKVRSRPVLLRRGDRLAGAPPMVTPVMETKIARIPMTTSYALLNLRGKGCMINFLRHRHPSGIQEMQAVKEALHVATVPTNVTCREEEQKKILEFCKACIEQEKAGSLYVCGCPGTGKTLSIDKVKGLLGVWSKEVGIQSPDTLAINCTSLTNTSEFFGKMLEKFISRRKTSNGFSPLQHLQILFSQKKWSSSGKMMLIIIDEMDYLITKDCAVLHDLFMLTTFPFSRCILIGIANAIDLADRFLPKLESLNCKPVVITFRAYSKDQIMKILQQRLMALGFNVFQPSALEFCARKVAAASGDMRRALGVCWNAVEVLEVQLQDANRNQDIDMVMLDHMDIALSKAFKSAVVDIIQSLPQHQQIILCSLVKLFHQCKKNATTLGELNKSYVEICKFVQIPAVGTLEFTSMCRVLSDQGLLKLGQSKEDKLKRVTLQIDISDITFAFKGIRFFQNCLEQ